MTRRLRRPGCLLAAIEDVAAAVLGPGGLVRFGIARLFIAEAYRLDLLLLHAQNSERALDALGALVAEREIVFAAAALVGVALHDDMRVAVVAQIAAVRFD